MIEFGDSRLPQRFWAKVAVASDDCWPWVGRCGQTGYGRYSLDGTDREAHQVAYRAVVGPIPPGRELDHLCRNHPCVNPAHLEAVTHRVNMLRSVSPAGWNAAKTHCSNGHLFDATNTYVYIRSGTVRRSCRACNRAAVARRAARLRLVGQR